jgi:ABC-type transport system involved in cytochrome bd biosynthesis fused ATPase/permease subunit
MTELVVRGDIEETLGGGGNDVGNGSSPHSQQKVLPLRQMPHEKPASSKASMFSSRPAKDLEWSNVNFRVKNQIQVLSNCWGSVKHGKVCAILGPSGILTNHPVIM